MNLHNWSVEDLEELDAKFDALCEHLGVYFVYEKISDGSAVADREQWYVKSKVRTPVDYPIARPKRGPTKGN